MWFTYTFRDPRPRRTSDAKQKEINQLLSRGVFS